ncbi:MAG TPA: hypothetical protein VFF06_12225 [Polyangia bacterium]|nr:hypothetical protein [Polyangia bacterium]
MGKPGLPGRILALAGIVCAARLAAAEEEHGHAHRFHVGVIGSAAGAFVGGEAFHAVGDGVFVTWLALPHRFEVELSARALSTEGGVELSHDLLGKVPFHVRPWFHPFIAIGPTVAEYFVGGETRDAPSRHGWGVGGALAIGADFWLARDFAIVAELNYNLLYRSLTAESETAGALVNEFGATSGALFAF